MAKIDPINLPIEYFTKEYLRHCGMQMEIVSTQTRDQIRMRYWKCRKCGKTGSTGEAIPMTRGQMIREERRH